MILGGIILMIAGAVVALLAFLNNTDMFSAMGKYGFGGWVARFFDLQYLTFQKVLFYLAVLAIIVGLILWLIGRSKAKKGNYQDEKAEKAGKYFRGLVSEAKKVVWPDRKTVVRNTLVTIAVCAILGLLIWLVDIGLSNLIQLVLSL